MEHLTVFIILRKDLVKTLSWPVGPIITQACHASTLAIFKNATHKNVIEYMNDEKNMHKVCLEVKNESQLMEISKNFKENNIIHESWIELPEDIFTCISTIPYKRSEVKDFIKKCQLYK
ncbi:peptidyl-tRNA hydrolase domain-containing protein 1 [Lobulomyces angularis]|nr:peptidyl-tRNA hydrolase domain-containing protein 1 [Lobulomyces angularis]